ncbi:MAG: type II toxin-antitoxin system RelE/ParE family toxin [Thauera sp.]|nr:type II toxin-antitoxin system RelE/ParE family toxin [Thauera sp.]
MPMAEYSLSPAAEGDLEGIWRYTANKWGVDQANRYLDEDVADALVLLRRRSVSVRSRSTSRSRLMPMAYLPSSWPGMRMPGRSDTSTSPLTCSMSW